jgi:hypothetical protein
MRRLASRQTFVVIALIVLLAAALAAVAALGRGDPGSSEQPARGAAATRQADRPARAHGDVAIATAYLGISRAQLRSELRAARTLAQIADATPGKSSSGLVHALVSARVTRVTSRVQAEVNRVRGSQGRRSGDGLIAAGYLGISRAQLFKALKGGRTLAQIADATPGKSAAGLIDALVAARKARLERAATAGLFPQAHLQRALSALRARVTARVNRTHQRPR